MKIHLFGASTPTGEALRLLVPNDLVGYSRDPSVAPEFLHYADLRDHTGFEPAGPLDVQSIWISFAPIWLMAPFLDQLVAEFPDRLVGLRGVIACSSSSAVTKRFAANNFDRKLVSRLIRSEEILIAACRRLSVPCRILRPTLIYGKIGEYEDQNVSRLTKLMRRFPVLVLPDNPGNRQPIHASQLAAVALHQSYKLECFSFHDELAEIIALGGDTVLNYYEMLRAIQLAQPLDDNARNCQFLLIPNRLFFLLASPLILFNPKGFEALLRMGVHLSGFTPVHHILSSEPQPFPVQTALH